MSDQDAEIASLLKNVKLMASSTSNQDFLKFMQDEQKAEQEKEKASEKQRDMSTLPSHLKSLIMSFVDDETRTKALKTPKNLLLPPSKFLPTLKDDGACLRLLTKADLEALDSKGFCIIDDFLKVDGAMEAVREDASNMYTEGILKLAGMNQGDQQWRDSSIRGDYHAWVNDRHQVKLVYPSLGALLGAMDDIKTELNENCAFGSEKTQIQVACYPGKGARYVRHLDAFIGGSSRRITCLYYMNKDWKPEDGGCLRLYLPDPSDPNGEQEITKDIEPLGNRLLIFQSRVIEHELSSLEGLYKRTKRYDFA